jgi:hypothetical protein
MSAIDWLRILDGFRYCFRTLRMVVLTLTSNARAETDTAEESH